MPISIIMYKFILAYLYLQLSMLNLVSQTKSPLIVRDNMLWFGYYNSIVISPKWSINTDIQFRTKNGLSNKLLGLIRTDVSYKFNDKFTLAIGVAHFRYFVTNEVTRGEWRPWQELKHTTKFGRLKLIQRLRVEQRFNETVAKDVPTNHYQFNFRFRYRFDLRYPIIKEKETGNNLYALVGNEIMFNAGGPSTYSYFDQDRLFGGLHYEINKKLSLQLLYMHYWQLSSTGSTLSSNEVIRFNIYHTITL